MDCFKPLVVLLLTIAVAQGMATDIVYPLDPWVGGENLLATQAYCYLDLGNTTIGVKDLNITLQFNTTIVGITQWWFDLIPGTTFTYTNDFVITGTDNYEFPFMVTYEGTISYSNGLEYTPFPAGECRYTIAE